MSKKIEVETKVYAACPWSCGGHRADYHELTATDDRETMLRTAWGKCSGSQYVSRIVKVEGETHTELWNERDGWKEG